MRDTRRSESHLSGNYFTEDAAPAPYESILPSKDRPAALLEAFKKHSIELSSIEDRVNKVLLVILAIFGAGATAITKDGFHLERVPAFLLMVVVLVITYLGWRYVSEMHRLRTDVRDLLVRCEMALDFFTDDVYLKGKWLYTKAELDYHRKGNYLRVTTMGILLVACVGLVTLIYVSSDFAETPLKVAYPSTVNGCIADKAFNMLPGDKEAHNNSFGEMLKTKAGDWKCIPVVLRQSDGATGGVWEVKK